MTLFLIIIITIIVIICVLFALFFCSISELKRRQKKAFEEINRQNKAFLGDKERQNLLSAIKWSRYNELDYLHRQSTGKNPVFISRFSQVEPQLLAYLLLIVHRKHEHFYHIHINIKDTGDSFLKSIAETFHFYDKQTEYFRLIAAACELDIRKSFFEYFKTWSKHIYYEIVLTKLFKNSNNQLPVLAIGRNIISANILSKLSEGNSCLLFTDLSLKNDEDLYSAISVLLSGTSNIALTLNDSSIIYNRKIDLALIYWYIVPPTDYYGFVLYTLILMPDKISFNQKEIHKLKDFAFLNGSIDEIALEVNRHINLEYFTDLYLLCGGFSFLIREMVNDANAVKQDNLPITHELDKYYYLCYKNLLNEIEQPIKKMLLLICMTPFAIRKSLFVDYCQLCGIKMNDSYEILHKMVLLELIYQSNNYDFLSLVDETIRSSETFSEKNQLGAIYNKQKLYEIFMKCIQNRSSTPEQKTLIAMLDVCFSQINSENSSIFVPFSELGEYKSFKILLNDFQRYYSTDVENTFYVSTIIKNTIYAMVDDIDLIILNKQLTDYWTNKYRNSNPDSYIHLEALCVLRMFDVDINSDFKEYHNILEKSPVNPNSGDFNQRFFLHSIRKHININFNKDDERKMRKRSLYNTIRSHVGDETYFMQRLS